MDILINKMTFPESDHLWLQETESNEYSSNNVCNGCNSRMTVFSQVVNRVGDIGLETSLCPQCGFTKRTRNLSAQSFTKHFSSHWLQRREEDIKENQYVYSKLKDHLPKSGKVLDLGCGLGGSLLAFKNAGYDVYGVEPSKHRSDIGMKIMPNITTGTAEEYLSNTEIKFDAIYLFDVLQFVEDPYKVLSMAIDSLVDGGKLWFKLGIYHHRSNFSQFSHFGMLRSYINMYSIMDKFNEWGVEPVYYQKEPFEIILSKSNNKSILESISGNINKLDMSDIEIFAKKSLNYNWMKLFGKTKIKYLNRVTQLQLIKPVESTFPVRFIHDTNSLPLILK